VYSGFPALGQVVPNPGKNSRSEEEPFHPAPLANPSLIEHGIKFVPHGFHQVWGRAVYEEADWYSTNLKTISASFIDASQATNDQ